MPGKKKETRPAYLSFGSGLRLWHEDAFMEALGLKRKAFRNFLIALHCPFLEIGSKRYVNVTEFILALNYITRIGRPNFLAPTSYTKGKKGGKKIYDLGHTTELDVKHFHKTIRHTFARMLYSRHMIGSTTTRELKRKIKSASDRMLLSALRHTPSDEQRRYIDETLAGLDAYDDMLLLSESRKKL